jgi:hypothetical protein
MAVAVCVHKYIRNGYIEAVTCIVHRLCLMLLDINKWITNVLFMKEKSMLPFSTWREQGRRERAF